MSGQAAMTEARSTSTARVKTHRARKRRGVHMALIEISEPQVDLLADEGYLDGDNTLGEAVVSFLADRLRSSRTRL
jgi:hypothetical protein